MHVNDRAHKLGFSRLRELLAEGCRTQEGRSAAEALAPSVERPAIERALDEVRELLVHRQRRGGELPLPRLGSIQSELNRARIEDNHLSPAGFHALRTWLSAAADLRHYLAEHAEELPLLQAYRNELPDVQALRTAIDRVVDDRGQLRGNASPELQRLRQAQAEAGQRLREQLLKTLEYARSQGWSTADAPALRSERLVLPIRSSAKHQLQGLVHDVSATGQTIFLEPIAALELNNRLRELRVAEEAEILRVLQALTRELRPWIPALEGLVAVTGRLDLLQAKARLAERLGAERPQLTGDNRLELRAARHPLLLAEKGLEGVVQMDLRLDEQERLVLISGPNAGGKSVAMQTLGVLQWMLQCGLLLPADAASVLPLRSALYVDMGDEQSLENDLSTYSSHLRNLRHILEEADAGSLVLLDEFGSGTDPALGGAIAEAALEHLLQLRVLGVMTTHYANLKTFAAGTPGIGNASLSFDETALRPTFRLEQGLPGSSFALEIAEQAGLPPALIQRAREKMAEAAASEDLLRELRARLTAAEEREAELQSREEAVAKREDQHHQRAEQFEAERTERLRQAEAEARELIEASNRRIEATIREIRESHADKATTRRARQQLAAAKPQARPKPTEPAAGSPEPEPAAEQPTGPLKPGERVRRQGSETVGTLSELRGERALVSFGAIQMEIPLAELERATSRGKPEGRPSIRSAVPRTAEPQLQLDLRGQRVEAALAELDRAMEAALVSGQPYLEVIHGKGTGALRRAVQTHLRQAYGNQLTLDPVRDAQGGQGMTRVMLAGGTAE